MKPYFSRLDLMIHDARPIKIKPDLDMNKRHNQKVNYGVLFFVYDAIYRTITITL